MDKSVPEADFFSGAARMNLLTMSDFGEIVIRVLIDDHVFGWIRLKNGVFVSLW